MGMQPFDADIDGSIRASGKIPGPALFAAQADLKRLWGPADKCHQAASMDAAGMTPPRMGQQGRVRSRAAADASCQRRLGS